MTETTVTLDQIKRLIRDERIKPEDLFEGEDLNDWRRRVEIEARLEAEKEAEKEAAADPDAKYLDPAKNPWIKTETD